MAHNPTNLTGVVFGRLTALEPAHSEGKRRWVCRCSCGAKRVVLESNLLGGNSKSCNNHRSTISNATASGVSHGAAKKSAPPLLKRTYAIYSGMLARCYTPSQSNYHIYGGKGISVCARWRRGFEFFLADMGVVPSAHLSLDRKDNTGNYTPKNCRWATEQEQALNKSTNRLITIGGDTKTMVEWTRIAQVPTSTFFNRVRRGWTGERLLSPSPTTKK